MPGHQFYCGEVEVPYLLYPGEPVNLPVLHCKHCHHTSYPRTPEAPKRCTNTTGYTDEKGRIHKACATQKWNRWPDDFDPEKLECTHCIILWNMEQQGIKPPPPPRRPGRPPKSHTNNKS
jgi:hypothetical protein